MRIDELAALVGIPTRIVRRHHPHLRLLPDSDVLAQRHGRHERPDDLDDAEPGDLRVAPLTARPTAPPAAVKMLEETA
ncbi:hypothetical protein [Actinomadura alba]|uniref:Uncharacterized protein n=2 Tax=Actinomadura alba TaxID=406431 RepID=A0ABR7LY59_9ACTN|nr:hypothetical protein [Actinomadura alba]